MKLSVPFRRVDQLYHWGTLDPQNVGKNGASQEGNCLSASLCPEAWLIIARLGGEQLHTLKKDDGRFVDIYSILKDESNSEVKQYLIDAAVDRGFIEMKTVFDVSSFNENDEPEGFQTYATYDEALMEADDVEENVQMVEKHVGTALLNTYMRVSSKLALLDGHEFGILATLRVLAAEGLKIDGVYFDDKYKPHEYIAPRFGLFPEKVAKWQFESVRNAPNDTVLLKTLGKTERLGLRSVQLTHGANLSM